MFTVVWHYKDSPDFIQGGFKTREDAERFVQDVESPKHRGIHSHIGVTIIEERDGSC